MTSAPERALLVSVDFPPHKDGVSSVSEALARKLTDEGYALWVIGPKSPQDDVYDRQVPFRVLRSPWYDEGYLRFIPLAILFVYAVWKWRPRIVFAMNIAYGGILAYALRFAGYRYYLWGYGYEFHKVKKNPLLRNLYLKIYGAARKIFVISHFVAARLEDFGVPRSKMQLVYPAVDPEKFKPLAASLKQDFFPRRNGERVILSVSRLVERKGQDHVLRALPTVLQSVPEACYWIAGDGPMRESLENLVKELHLEDKVRFLGKVGDDPLVQLYNQCDVFVMPSKECENSGHVEGFGIVFLEANACGKPVIGGRSGGMPEAIEEGKTGFLVSPQDTPSLSAALILLLKDTKLAEVMGANGRQRVLERFNWGTTLRAMDLN